MVLERKAWRSRMGLIRWKVLKYALLSLCIVSQVRPEIVGGTAAAACPRAPMPETGLMDAKVVVVGKLWLGGLWRRRMPVGLSLSTLRGRRSGF